MSDAHHDAYASEWDEMQERHSMTKACECGNRLEKNHKFCYKCGKNHFSKCKTCGEFLEHKHIYCPICGTKK